MHIKVVVYEKWSHMKIRLQYAIACTYLVIIGNVFKVSCMAFDSSFLTLPVLVDSARSTKYVEESS